MRIILVGVSCVGKSTVGQLIANKHGFTFIDFDWECEKRTGERITEMKKKFLTEHSYRDYVNHILDAILTEYPNNLILAMPPGGMFQQYTKHYKKHPDLIIVALKDTAKNIIKRLVFYDDESQFDSTYTVTPENYDYYHNDVKEDIAYFNPKYKNAHIHLSVNGRPAEEVAEELWMLLQEKRHV
jgi:shikimate kinase